MDETPLPVSSGHDQLDAGEIETLEIPAVEREQACRASLEGAAQDQGRPGRPAPAGYSSD